MTSTKVNKEKFEKGKSKKVMSHKTTRLSKQELFDKIIQNCLNLNLWDFSQDFEYFTI